MKSHTPLRLQTAVSRGFTLLELLIVLVIMAILLAIVAPSLLNNTQAKLNRSGTQVTGMFAEARSRAIAERTLYAVGVVVKDPIDAEAPYRTLVLLKNANQANETQTNFWNEASPRFTLPDGIIVDPKPATNGAFACFLGSAEYIQEDPSIAQGEFLSNPGSPYIAQGFGLAPIPEDPNEQREVTFYNALTFFPDGRSQVKGSSSRQAGVILTEGILELKEYPEIPDLFYTNTASDNHGQPATWVHIVADGISGRVSTHMP